jgi:hypothetical protein
LGVLVFFCVGLAVVVGVIIYSKETAPPEPTPAVDEEYLARKKAEAEERAASEAGAEEAKKKWREENERAEQFAERATKITKGMKLEEIETLMGGEALGSCKDKDGHRAYLWDTGPAHTPILVALKGGRFSYGKLTTVRNPELRALMMPLAEGGKCKPPDYDSAAVKAMQAKAGILHLPPGPNEHVDGMGPGTLARKAALIKPGWPLAKVEQLLGEPYGKCMTKKERNWRYIWENGINIPVKIEFEDDKVVRVDPSMWVEKPDYKDMHLLFDANGTCGQND